MSDTKTWREWAADGSITFWDCDERDDALAALRHVRSVIPHGLPGSLYAVARGVADAVLEEHKEGE